VNLCDRSTLCSSWVFLVVVSLNELENNECYSILFQFSVGDCDAFTSLVVVYFWYVKYISLCNC